MMKTDDVEARPGGLRIGLAIRLAGRQRRELAELVEHIMMLCCARVLGFVGNRCDQAFRASPDG